MTRDERLLMTALRVNACIRPAILLSVPAVLLYRPVALIAAHPDSTDVERAWGAPVLGQIKAACHEPFQGLAPVWRARAESMVQDLCKWGMQEASERRARTAMWAALAVLYWMEKATDEVPDLLPEGGPLHHAAFSLLEQIGKHQGIADTYDDSARGGARRLGKAFDRIELFPAARQAAA